jgi:hypothetical protein
MKFRFALIIAAPLLFGGCANIVPAFDVLTGSIATQAPVTVATAEKALTVAHLALNTIGTDIIAATNSGVLHGANATVVKGYYDTADDDLKAADQLDAVANATGVMDKVNAADALIAMIHPLAPSK